MPVLSLNPCFPQLPLLPPCLPTHLPTKCSHSAQQAGCLPVTPGAVGMVGAVQERPWPSSPHSSPPASAHLRAPPGSGSRAFLRSGQPHLSSSAGRLTQRGPIMAEPSGRLSLECSTNAHFPTCFPGPTVGPKSGVRKLRSSGEPGRLYTRKEPKEIGPHKEPRTVTLLW